MNTSKSPFEYEQLLPIIQELQNQLILKSNEADQITLKDSIEQFVSGLEEYTIKEKAFISEYLHHAIEGYDVIQPLLDDSRITEIMINGPKNIFIEKDGDLFHSNVVFHDEEHLMQLVQKISIEIDRPINLTKPILDARLKDGSRVNVVLSPIANDGPVLTIRKFSQSYTSLDDLLNRSFFSLDVRKFLALLVKSRYNLFLCGSTGSGKTTLLNCLSSEIPLYERIITIEDSRELQLKYHQNLISLETRDGQSSLNTISISDLIKSALRMRPNRIVVGEVRGSEVIDMLQAMNTGHDGSMSTGHGNSPRDMLIRLESIGASTTQLSSEIIRHQIISAIDFVINIERLPNGERKLTQIAEIIKNVSTYELKVHYDYFDGITPDIKRVENLGKYNKYKLYGEEHDAAH